MCITPAQMLDCKFYSARQENRQDAIEKVVRAVQHDHEGVTICFDVKPLRR